MSRTVKAPRDERRAWQRRNLPTTPRMLREADAQRIDEQQLTAPAPDVQWFDDDAPIEVVLADDEERRAWGDYLEACAFVYAEPRDDGTCSCYALCSCECACGAWDGSECTCWD